MLSDRCLFCLSCLSVCDAGVLWRNGWMDQDAIEYGAGVGQGDIVLDGDPAPHKKGAQQPAAPILRPMSTVTKLLDESRCHWVRT